MKNIFKYCFNTSIWSPIKSEWQLLLSSLPRDERDRIIGYMFKRDSKQTLIGQVLIRYCLQAFLKTQWKNICIGRNSKGRPFLKLKETLCLSRLNNLDSSIDFNVSHSGDYTIIIAGMFPSKKKSDDIEDTPKVGSDVMKIDIDRSKAKYPNESDEFLFQHQLELLERVIDSKFSTMEKNYIQNRPNPVEKLTAFYRLWCLKESYVKAVGEGLGFDIRRIECLPRSELFIDLNIKKCLVVDDTQLFIDSKVVKNCKFYEQYFMHTFDSTSGQVSNQNQKPQLHIMTYCIIENEKSNKDKKEAELIKEFISIDLKDILDNITPIDNIEDNEQEFEEYWKKFCEKDEKPLVF